MPRRRDTPVEQMQDYPGEDYSELERQIAAHEARNHKELGMMIEVIKAMAVRIERRNANGEVSRQFCLLCVLGQPQFKRMPCIHDTIWKIAREF